MNEQMHHDDDYKIEKPEIEPKKAMAQLLYEIGQIDDAWDEASNLRYKLSGLKARFEDQQEFQDLANKVTAEDIIQLEQIVGSLEKTAFDMEEVLKRMQ